MVIHLKKKILLVLVGLVSFCSFSTVHALSFAGNIENVTCSGVSPRHYPIERNNSVKASMYIYYTVNGTRTMRDKTSIWYQKLNGNYALCLAPGWTSDEGLIWYPTKLKDNNLTDPEYNHYRKAYQYLMDTSNVIWDGHTYVRDKKLQYIVAQMAVWISSLSTDGLVSEEDLTDSVTSAYCTMFSWTFANLDPTKDDNCKKGELGFSKTYYVYKNTIKAYSHAYVITGFYDARKLGIYYTKEYFSGSQIQPLLSKYVCNSNCEETNSCPTEPTPDTPDGTCNYETDVANIPTNCNNSNSGFISDIDDWNCIFNSTSQTSPINSRYLEDDNNNYCNIFCREEVNAEFPTNGISVMQGKYMTVGIDAGTGSSISPISYGGKKTCRPTSAVAGTINVEQFKTDLIAIDNQIPANWDNLQNAYASWKAAGASTCQVTNSQYRCKHSLDPSEAQKSQCSSEANSWADTETAKHFRNNPTESRSESEIHNIKYNEKYSECMSNLSITCDDYYTQSTCTGSYANGEYGNITTTFTVEEGENTRESKISGYQTNYTNALSTYNGLVGTRDGIISRINSCTEAASHVKFDDFDPSLEINYDEPIYGNMNSQGFELKGNLSQNKDIVYYKGGNAASGTSSVSTRNISDTQLRDKVTVKKCGTNGQRCRIEQRNYYTTTWWNLDYYKTYDYQLQDGVYRYVEKGSGQSVHNITNYNIEYVDIGFSNLPIHYSTDPGNYDYTITTNSLGNGNRFNEEFNMSNIYSCQYNVSCDDTIQNNSLTQFRADCPGTTTNITGSGLNVVYRTISLYSKEKAFPGLNGTGRTPGDNWNNDTLINTYIVNNRGVTDYEVYHLDPMYEIELTPSMMKLFRQYNKKKNREVVTMYSSSSAATSGIAGYSDFSNMRCNSDGTHCVSSLLRGNVTGYTQIKITGCAISNSGIYGNCGSNNQAW